MTVPPKARVPYISFCTNAHPINLSSILSVQDQHLVDVACSSRCCTRIGISFIKVRGYLDWEIDTCYVTDLKPRLTRRLEVLESRENTSESLKK